MYHPTVIPRSNERTGPPIIPSPPTNPKGPPASPCLASDTAAGSSTSQVMNLMNVEAAASPSPIVAAFVLGTSRRQPKMLIAILQLTTTAMPKTLAATFEAYTEVISKEEPAN